MSPQRLGHYLVAWYHDACCRTRERPLRLATDEIEHSAAQGLTVKEMSLTQVLSQMDSG